MNNQCCICLEELNDNVITLEPCGHILHTLCYNAIINSNIYHCSLCRSYITTIPRNVGLSGVTRNIGLPGIANSIIEFSEIIDHRFELGERHVERSINYRHNYQINNNYCIIL